MEKRIRQFDVLQNEDGMRLDEFLAFKIARFSRSQANNCIKAGAVSITPYRPAKPALKVHFGDSVAISQTMSGDVPQYDEIQLLLDHPDFWCFSKPAGMAVHPTANIYHNTVTRYVETQLNAQPYVVHRLDKDTSGVLLMAKTPDVSKALGEAFLTHLIHKEYLAIVYNAASAYYVGRQNDILIPLGLAGRVLPNMTMGMGTLDAHSEVHCIDTLGDFAKLRILLHSGRQHQIRVHLSLTGTPILGDKLYFFGEQFYKDYLDQKLVPNYTPCRHLLHAQKLSFTWKGEEFSITSPVPALFDEVYRSPITDAIFPTGYAQLFRK